MKLLSKNKFVSLIVLSIIFSIFVFSKNYSTFVYAHKMPDNCSGSGLGIQLNTDKQNAHIGDTILYSLNVYNSPDSGDHIICDVTEIKISITTPDGVIHNIVPIREGLMSGESDSYNNIVSYIVRNEDVKDGILITTAVNTGNVHQNATDSQGGGNQSVNVTIIKDEIITQPIITPTDIPVIRSGGGGPIITPIITPVIVPIIATTTPTIIFTPYFPVTGFN